VANIKSQIKRNRQNDKQRLRNRVYRGEARIAVKAARTTIEEGIPESKEALKQAISALDKAAEQGVIHKNNAARRKSRLAKAYNKMEPVAVMAAPAVAEPAVEAEPVKKKAAPRRTASASSPKATKAEPKVAARKPAATSSPKGKKPAAKKAATTAKKATTTRKKTTAKE
jgi:small subunit ribosomal protein S20